MLEAAVGNKYNRAIHLENSIPIEVKKRGNFHLSQPIHEGDEGLLQVEAGQRLIAKSPVKADVFKRCKIST